jgi:hypothetical protein
VVQVNVEEQDHNIVILFETWSGQFHSVPMVVELISSRRLFVKTREVSALLVRHLSFAKQMVWTVLSVPFTTGSDVYAKLRRLQ